MKLSYRLALPLVALSLALAVAPALAAKTAPTPIALPGGPSHVNGSSTICQMGNTAADQAAVWFYASDDYYYELIDPAQCGCPNGAMGTLTANWMLFYPTACTLQLQVWIVRAIDSGGGCYIPDAGPGDPPDPTAAETLCGPTAIITQPGSGLFVHTAALPLDCCINEKAFVLFKIVGPGDCPVTDGVLDSPAIVFENTTPAPCESYNGFLGGPPSDMLGFGFPGNITMWVDANCCDIVPTMPGTWGGLKTLYR